MRYFGSKEKLFAQAAAIPPDGPIEGSPEEIAVQLTAGLSAKLAEEPAAAMAAMRAMFSHPEAAEEVRAAMAAQQRQVAEQLPGEDAVLRSGVIGALITRAGDRAAPGEAGRARRVTGRVARGRRAADHLADRGFGLTFTASETSG